MDEMKLGEKLDATNERLSKIQMVLVRQEAQLTEHMRRTAIQETTSERLWAAIEIFKKSMDDQLAPIQRHVTGVQYIFAFLGVLATLAGLVEAILKSIELVK